MEHKYDVFISYSRKDIEEVTQLVDMLKKRIPTLDCWFDITGIECGDEEFDEKIVKIIDNSSYVLFALSKNSMESKWAKDEVMYAKNVGKKVIPVLLDGAKLEGWFLFKFGRVDCIDSTKDIQIDKMMKNISEWTKKPILKKEEVEQHEGENVKKIISDVKHPTPKPSYTKYILGVLAVVLGVVIGVVMTGDEPAPEESTPSEEVVVEPVVVQEEVTVTSNREEQESIAEEQRKLEQAEADRKAREEQESIAEEQRKREQAEADRKAREEQERIAEEQRKREQAEADRKQREEQERIAEEQRNARKQQSGIYTANGVTFKMIAVQGGTYTMGATSKQGSDVWDCEKPTHKETVSDFMIGETPVTQELWQAVMGSNPSNFTGDMQRPVERVSWDDCQTFIRKLNQLTGQNFRLPSEAEWEYAARGGNRSDGYKYAGSNSVGTVAWYNGNSGNKTHPVKTKQPNELGIYDMSGNVWEWCQDKYNYNSPRNSGYRVLRGGSWFNYARDVRVSDRSFSSPDNRNYNYGLRLAL